MKINFVYYDLQRIISREAKGLVGSADCIVEYYVCNSSTEKKDGN